MEWALLGIFILVLILAYIVVQGTRAALAWRQAAAAGDVKVIRDIAEDALSVWRSTKRPKDVAPEIWRGVQSMQLVDAAAGFVRVSCEAESDYRLLDTRWIEMANPLQVGIAITARGADMLLYELPHFKADRIQIDVYTTFRDEGGATRRSCILSTIATRESARGVDWEEWTPAQIVAELGGRYSLGERGQPLPIEVEDSLQLMEAESDGTAATAAS